jgi:hypothetical protein
MNSKVTIPPSTILPLNYVLNLAPAQYEYYEQRERGIDAVN